MWTCFNIDNESDPPPSTPLPTNSPLLTLSLSHPNPSALVASNRPPAILSPSCPNPSVFLLVANNTPPSMLSPSCPNLLTLVATNPHHTYPYPSILPLTNPLPSTLSHT